MESGSERKWFADKAQELGDADADATAYGQDEVRSVDIMPMILRAMGIQPTYPMDGVAYPLPTKRGR
jgi:GTP cyclohydrolase II